ncbi:MAG: type II secretion system F family protein [Nitrospirae bacterium]|nr:type II secretion system F family protein [Nitrospirota bacterium]
MNIVVIIILTFMAIATGIISLYLMIGGFRQSSRSAIKARLANMETGHPGSLSMPGLLREELLSEIPAVNRILYKFPVMEKLAVLIEQANVQIKVGQLLFLTLTIGMTGWLTGILINRGVLFTIGLGLFLAAAPYLYIKWRKKQRIIKFEEQFPETLNTIARSLNAGHSFTAAQQYAAQESADPVGTLFTTAIEEQSLGLSHYDSLRRMAYRMDSMDLVFFITAVNIQRVTGGNLVEILRNLSDIIKERLKLKRQVRVYTAQGRFSGYILAALPIVMMFLLNMLNPDYISLLFRETVGHYLLAAAVILQAIGFLFIRKIVNIKI